MKKFHTTAALIVAAALLLAPAVMAEEMTLEKLIANHIDAIGGRDTIDNVQSLTMVGKMTMGQGMEAPFSVKQKRPNKIRIEFEFQGMTGIQAFDGETGWFVMPFMGKTDPEKMPPDQVDDMKEQADIEGALVDWEKKGHMVELLGTEEIDGAETYKVHLTRANGNEVTMYLDAEYFLPIKQTGEREMMGTPVQFSVTLGDYKEVGGMMLPHSITQQAVGAPGGQTITIDTVEINAELSDDLFAMPAPAPAAPAEAEGE